MAKSYLHADQSEILTKAKELLDKSLRDLYGDNAVEKAASLRIKSTDKGKLGNLVEVLHFGLPRNQRPGPDFIKANIELKTTGLKQNREGLVAKERLTLGMIDYMRFKDPQEWNFEKSGLLKKSETLLLMVYLYLKDALIVDLDFRVIDFWKFSDADLEVIRNDWSIIIEKVKSGRAHELSDSDTLYLMASRKGSSAGSPKPQPFSRTLAKGRAFALRPAYLDHAIAVLSKKTGKKYGRIISDPTTIRRRRKSLEQIVIEKFERFYGESIDDIAHETGVELNPSSKSFAAKLTKAVLQISLEKKIEEFEKAGIIVRTVRLQPNDLPKESVSFPAFEYKEIIHETWEDSEFRDQLDSKFLFIFFQFEDEILYLRKALFWNMPVDHIDYAKSVWEKTVELVKRGQIYKSSKRRKDGKVIRYTYFPNKDENLVAHVRPHGSDSSDTYPLPVTDIKSGKDEYTKHSFWLNNTYIRDYVYRAK
jgi:DNA mismatch repair protein MutH